jgi:hypothetical protein
VRLYDEWEGSPPTLFFGTPFRKSRDFRPQLIAGGIRAEFYIAETGTLVSNHGKSSRSL